MKMKTKTRNRINPHVQAVQNSLKRINFGRLATKVATDLRRQVGIHGITWILMNHFAPGRRKPSGIY
jgi:hypothetical protein